MKHMILHFTLKTPAGNCHIINVKRKLIKIKQYNFSYKGRKPMRYLPVSVFFNPVIIKFDFIEIFTDIIIDSQFYIFLFSIG